MVHEFLNPDPFLHQNVANDTFQNIRTLADKVKWLDRKVCKTAQAVSQRNAHHPDVTAVKEEGNDGLSAGTQSKIGSVHEGVHRHEDRRPPR